MLGAHGHRPLKYSDTAAEMFYLFTSATTRQLAGHHKHATQMFHILFLLWVKVVMTDTHLLVSPWHVY